MINKSPLDDVGAKTFRFTNLDFLSTECDLLLIADNRSSEVPIIGLWNFKLRLYRKRKAER